MKFTIENKHGETIPKNSLDFEAATIFGKELNEDNFANPHPVEGDYANMDNWHCALGLKMVFGAHDWDAIIEGLEKVVARIKTLGYDKEQEASSIHIYESHIKLAAHWKAMGYAIKTTENDREFLEM